MLAVWIALTVLILLSLRRPQQHRVRDAAVGCSGCPSSCRTCASPDNNPDKPCTDMQCTSCSNGTPVHGPTRRTIDGKQYDIGTCRSKGAGPGCMRCHADCAKCEHPRSQSGEWKFECGDTFCTECADPNDSLTPVGTPGRTPDGRVIGRCV